jgi:uncharacterized protein (TIGR02757 family)
MEIAEIKDFLEEKYDEYNRPEFIQTDPVQIPHLFTNPDDIEIAGFFSAIIAWGQRTTIIKNGMMLMKLMDNNPHDFILNAGDSDYTVFKNFRHRTFNYADAVYFCKSLKNIHGKYGGLKTLFENSYNRHDSLKNAIIDFRKVFFEIPHPGRTTKHISDISKGSAAKRINMFLRWMVRKDRRGVDFGIWNSIPSASLYIPLDIHTGSVARKLGILRRKQNDWKAVEQLTEVLRGFDRDDPVKYDYALFGLGVTDAL